MRAPHPSVRGLYAAAATPSQMMTRLRRPDEHFARFDVALIPGGKDGDALFVRLTRGLPLGDLLDATLARLHAPAPPGSAASSAPHERTLSPQGSPSQSPSRDDFSDSHGGAVPRNRSVGDSPSASKSGASAPAPATPPRGIRLSSDAPPRADRAPKADGATDLGRVLSLLRKDDPARHEREAGTRETPLSRGTTKREAATPPPPPLARRRPVRPQLHLAHHAAHADDRSPAETRGSGPRRIAPSPVSRVEDTHAASPASHEPPTANGDETPTAGRGTRERTIDRQTAHAALVRRAARRGVTEALGQHVGRDVPPRVAVMLRRHAPDPSSPAHASARRDVDAAAPLDPMRRVAETVDRLERSTARRPSSAARPSTTAPERVSVVHDGTAAPASSPHASSPHASSPHASSSHASSPHVSSSHVSSPHASSPNASRATGFRGLVARLEAQHARVASGATAAGTHEESARSHELAAPQEMTSHRAAGASTAPALDDAVLLARIGEMLRREAERHGIDVTGVEP